jgi:hypothetical protein
MNENPAEVGVAPADDQPKEPSLDDVLRAKGSNFRLFFYIILGLYVLELVSSVLPLLLAGPILALFAIPFILPVIMVFKKKKNIYGFILGFFIQVPVAGSLIGFGSAFIKLPNEYFYAASFLLMFIPALFAAFMADKVSEKSGNFVMFFVSLSFMLSIIFAMNYLMMRLFVLLSGQLASLNLMATGIPGADALLSLFSSSFPDAHICFAFAYMGLFLPFAWRMLRRPDFRIVHLVYLAIPASVYIALIPLFNYIIGNLNLAASAAG